ncbi:MAG: hypothetical protein GX863_08590 [Firmicutes bacterium]|jgi:hypothetical protein|nr:hypothetical protein [Candidatus Fermentithermobacillaceae bacterium]
MTEGEVKTPVETKPTGQDPQILWADVGERLGVTVTELRGLRTAFGDLLGLGPGRTVSESMVPILGHIQALRREGVPDEEIRQEIAGLSGEPGWPEIVLTRMQAASSASEAIRVALEPAASVSICEPPPEEQPHKATPQAIPQDTVREMVFDLRREIAMNTHSDRELMLHLTQCVRKLALEVRDLRYAFLLASSRKDRKKGVKALSRLLSN